MVTTYIIIHICGAIRKNVLSFLRTPILCNDFERHSVYTYSLRFSLRNRRNLNRNVKERGKNRNEDINLEILIWKATIVQAQLRKSDKKIRLKRSDNLEFEKKKKNLFARQYLSHNRNSLNRHVQS